MTQPAPVPATRRLLARIIAALTLLVVAGAALALWSDRRARDSEAKLEAARQALRGMAEAEATQAAATARVKAESDQRGVEIARQQARGDSLSHLSDSLRVAVRKTHIVYKTATTAADSGAAAIVEVGQLRPLVAKLLREKRADAQAMILMTADRDQWRADAQRWADSARARSMRLGEIDKLIASSSCHLVNIGNLHVLKCPSRTTVFFVGAALGAAVGIAADQLAH